MTPQMTRLARIATWAFIAILVAAAFFVNIVAKSITRGMKATAQPTRQAPALTPTPEISAAIDQMSAQIPQGWLPQEWDSQSALRSTILFGVDWANWIDSANTNILTESYINRYAGRPFTMLVGNWQVEGAYAIDKPFPGVAFEISANGAHSGGAIRGVLLLRGTDQPLSELRQDLFIGTPLAFSAVLLPVGIAKVQAKDPAAKDPAAKEPVKPVTKIVFVPLLKADNQLPSPLNKFRNDLLPSKSQLQQQFRQRRDNAKSPEEIERIKKDYETAQAAGLV
jgi:hypothetical protein